jgi:hypothetical protein
MYIYFNRKNKIKITNYKTQNNLILKDKIKKNKLKIEL